VIHDSREELGGLENDVLLRYLKMVDERISVDDDESKIRQFFVVYCK
jgi:hypothetical protein